MGPLAGIRLIELAGIGPGPMAAMMLGDLGADVIRVDRLRPSGPPSVPGRFNDPRHFVHGRSRRSIAIDLRQPGAAEIVLRLAEHAGGLMEPFRPGVAERLGIGPEPCFARNPKLVYGRMTGWGQDGPLAKAAGHDINYIALAGALGAIGRTGDKPVPPLNLVGDFGGGGMLLALGMVCGLLETARSGRGQVIDAAMVDGTALLLGAAFGMHAAGQWHARGTNTLDGGAHFYDTYETGDGLYIAIGAIEPQFYAILLEKTGLAGEKLPEQTDRTAWPALRERLAGIFRSKTRDEWCAIMEGTDICFAPVLSLAEAPQHPHARARDAFVDMDGVAQPAPAPRFSRTPPQARVAPRRGEHTDEVLREAGFAEAEIASLRSRAVIT